MSYAIRFLLLVSSLFILSAHSFGQDLVRAVGWNANGQLGDGTFSSRKSFVVVQNLPNVKQLASRHDFNVALKTDGSVWTWGRNEKGALGNGGHLDSAKVTKVSGLPTIVQVAAGWQHVLALDATGKVWAWGDNASGELGIGSTQEMTLPIQIPNFTGIVQVACGSEHSLAVDSNGNVWAWGLNGYGQVGNGNTINQTRPILVSGLSGVKIVAGGQLHSLALVDDGSVRAWGYNGAGALGNGSWNSSLVPVKSTLNVKVKGIAAGFRHSAILSESGTVYTCGDNSRGCLGNGATTNRNLFQLVSGLSGIIRLDAGVWQTLALSSKGVMYGWGYNGYGQLGDGTTSDKLSPIVLPSSQPVNSLCSGGFHNVVSIRSDPIDYTLSLNQASVPWGAPFSAKLVFQKAVPAGGVEVKLSSSSNAFAPPESISVPGGSAAYSFDVPTKPVLSNTKVTLTAVIGSIVRNASGIVLAGGDKFPATDVLFFDTEGRQVQGIVCDNTAYTSDKDVLKVSLTAAYQSTTMKVDFNGAETGQLVPGKSSSTYFPPLEFNQNDQPASWGDLTKDSFRPVQLRVLARNASGSWKVAYPTIYIARPPIVFVHGILNQPSSLKATRKSISDNFDVPFSAVNHNYGDWGFNGKGTVERAAKRIAEAIDQIKERIRNGEPIPADVNYPSLNPGWSSFTKWNGKRLAIKRVDLIGHSYGGLIARWYLADRKGVDSRSWYLPTTRGVSVDTPPPYRGDVRKLITFGSMWRGVPICNELSECLATANETSHYGDAPFNPSPVHLETTLGKFFTATSEIDGYDLPTWQVMSCESRWLRFLNYGGADLASPNRSSVNRVFRDDVAYGSVAGDDSDYLGFAGVGVIDIYDYVGGRQLPSWFPYRSLEVRVRQENNYHDGIVPLWSAALPGEYGRSYVRVHSPHDEVIKNDRGLSYAMCMLNSVSCAGGKQMRIWWDDPTQAIKADGGYNWLFPGKKMLPEYQQKVYANVGGVGRLEPTAVREKDNIEIVLTRRNYIRFRVRTVADYLEPIEVLVKSGLIVRDRVGDTKSRGKRNGWYEFDVQRPFDPGEYSLTFTWQTHDAPSGTVVKLQHTEIKFTVN